MFFFQSEPYAMLKKDSEGQYEGFVVDLAEKIASIVGFNYTIMPTKAHGSVDKSGQWNGMIKELLEEVQKGLFLEAIFDLFLYRFRELILPWRT